METKNKIIRAKVHLQRQNPFFAYLVMNLKIIEKKEIETIGVDGKGNVFYNAKWIDDLKDNELKGVLCHEVLHLALEHLIRGQNKEHLLYNIASDLVINNILVNNNFELPSGLIPYNNQYRFDDTDIIVENLDKKSADEVYKELYDKLKSLGQFSGLGFDKHDYSLGNKDGKCDKSDQKKLEQVRKEWKKIFTEASIYARQQGNLPSGMELLVDLILNEKVGWKQLLYKYITRELPYDYSYNYPSRKSHTTGVYMPSIKKESIDIVVSIDTSGSVRQEELSEFLSEIVNIAKSFNNLNMKLIVCDSEIKDIYEVKNGSIQTILELKIKGGGGTSFITPLNYIEENMPNTKFVIFFTDGYGDEIKQGDYPFGLIWAITSGGTDDYIKESGEVIKLD